MVCDLTIAADNAIFGQTGPKVGSFDGGLGSSYLARIVGQKKAREIWYLCRQYNSHEALDMGLVNKVVPVDQLEAEGLQWASEVMEKSPLAIRCLKSAFNAELDGQSGIQELAGNATLLYYLSEEGSEGKKAFWKRENRNLVNIPGFPEQGLLIFPSPVGSLVVVFVDHWHSGVGFFLQVFKLFTSSLTFSAISEARSRFSPMSDQPRSSMRIGLRFSN